MAARVRMNTATLAALALSAGLAGCAWKEYRAKPLDLSAADIAAQSRSLEDDSTRASLEAAGVDLRGWPALVWSRETLLITLLASHPEMQAARARVVAAWARVPAVQQPINPDLALRSENHSQRGDNGSPWSIGASLQFTFNTRPLLSAQGGVAAAEASEAEIAAGEVAWRLYRQLGEALLAVEAAEEGGALAREGVSLAEARAESVAIRQRHGAAPALEMQLAQEALLSARRELVNLEAAAATARAQLAQALALPVEHVQHSRLAPWPVLAPQAGGDWSGPDAAAARGTALRNRLDLARELSLYQVAEAQVRLEVARQYPQIRLGPGLLWDQGDNIWQIGLALPLALLQRNRAAIDAAEARREAQAAQVLARQRAVVGEVEAARQRAMALAAVLQAALREAAAAVTRVDLVRRQFDAGAADAASLIAARSVALQARRQVHDTTVLWRQAQWSLEAALQSPLQAVDSGMQVATY